MKDNRSKLRVLLSRIKREYKKKLQSAYLSKTYSKLNYPPATKGSVLMYVALGYSYLTPLETLMYHLLRLEGYDVDYLIYDNSVPLNELTNKKILTEIGKDKFWNGVVKESERILKASNVNYSFIKFPEKLDELVKPVKNNLDAILKFTYDGIDFGDIVLGVMYRFYKSTNFESDAADRAAEFLKTALANYVQVKEQCERKTYKYVMFSHGIYCTWQPVAEYCRLNHINYVCYDRGKRNASTNFNINQPSPDWSFNTAWERFAGRKLTEQEYGMVKQYMADRELQKGDVYSYNPAPRQADILAVKKELGIHPSAKVITIFTNLIWDAANVARDIAFKSALDCIVQTIDYYKNNPDVHIAIRSHPAEKVLGTNERYGSLIKEKFNNNLPANVSIIEPDMNVNSFTVIDMSDIGVVNTSTVGLEFAMMGKPIILISETNYRNKGFTYDPVTSAEYFEILNRLLQTGELLNDQVELADKYFYMMMFLYQKDIPVNYKNGLFDGYSFKKPSDLPATDNIMRIIKSLEQPGLKDFIFWD